jgi:hypothetical protein
MNDFIHNDPDFGRLISIVSNKLGIDFTLIEKDYWIMHVLYSLQERDIEFELKGGTSLSKGFGLIQRFSEDIDIHIRTNFGLSVNGNEDKPVVRAARKSFYDVLAATLSINGITKIERDREFDDVKYRSGGIRLFYQGHSPISEGIKDGILLEAGFDQITPNYPVDISSWIWEYLASIGLDVNYIDNRAKLVPCYHPGYTLVEKLQTIVRKYRTQTGSNGGVREKNFLRQYYDVYCLLGNDEIQSFIGSEEYNQHKKNRIKGADKEIPLSEHPALNLSNSEIKTSFKERYQSTSKLYYQGQPDFEEVLTRIRKFQHRL